MRTLQTQRQKEHPTQSDYNFIIQRIHVKDWDKNEDEACRRWFGVKYLGEGMLLCAYCLEAQVEFKGYLADHVCAECEESIKQLDQ